MFPFLCQKCLPPDTKAVYTPDYDKPPLPCNPGNSPKSTHLFVAEQLLYLSCNLSKANVPVNPVTAVELTALSSHITLQHLFESIMLGSQFHKGCRNKDFPNWGVDA